MKVRGKKLLAAMLSLAMVLSMFVVPASAVTQKKWDFENAEGGSFTGDAFTGVTVDGEFQSGYGAKVANGGSIKFHVDGKCNINVRLKHNWKVWLNDDKAHTFEYTAGGGDKVETFHYDGEAGTVTLNTGTMSWISYIELDEYTASDEANEVEAKKYDFESATEIKYPGLELAGLSWSNPHGPSGGTGTLTVSIPADKTAKLTVTLCCYSPEGSTVEASSNGKALTVTEGTAAEEESGKNYMPFVIEGATGETVLTLKSNSQTSGLYLRSLEVAFTNAGTDPEPVDPEPQPEPGDGKVDVYDFGAAELDETKFNNKLTVDEINSWYPSSVIPGSLNTKNVLGDFSTDNGNLSLNANGKEQRLRTKNSALTRYDEKTLTGDGKDPYMGAVTYNGYIYSNSSSTEKVYLSLKANKGDVLTYIVGSNKNAATYTLESPSGAKTTGEFDGDGGDTLTFYPAETGAYKLYTLNEKLVVARVYRERPTAVEVSGNLDATALTDATGLKLVFTNDDSGLPTEATIKNDGTYTVTLNNYQAGTSYTVEAEGVTGGIVKEGMTLVFAKDTTATTATHDVTVGQVPLVDVSGKLTSLSADALGRLKLTLTPPEGNIYVPDITVTGDTWSAKLQSGVEYTVTAENVNDYTLGTTTMKHDATVTDVVFTAKPTYAVTIVPTGLTLDDLADAVFTFTNVKETYKDANDKDVKYSYTFTGPNAIALRDGQYAVKVDTDKGRQELTADVTVNGAVVNCPIGFDVSVPTEWDFRSGSALMGAANGVEINGTSGTFYGLKINAEATGSKFDTKNRSDWAQVNKDTKISVPVSAADGETVTLTVNCYDAGKFTVGGTANTKAKADENFTCTVTNGAVEIVCTSNSYIGGIKVAAAFKDTVTVGEGKDCATIGEALALVGKMPRPNNERVTIVIDPGDYEEQLWVDVPNVTLKNAKADAARLELKNKGVDIGDNEVRVTWYYGHGYNYYSMTTGHRYDEKVLAVNKQNGYPSFTNLGSGNQDAGSYWNATVVVVANGFQAEGIIFENSFNQYVSAKAAKDVLEPQKGQATEPADAPRATLPQGSTAVQGKKYVERAAALAIGNNYGQAVFDNCAFIGRQDTLDGGRGTTAAFYNCDIYGGTDFIMGPMNAVFAKCDLVLNTSEDKNDVAYITAAQQESGRGYLMYNCSVISTIPGVNTASEKVSKPGYFGRPWKANTGEAVFYETIIDTASDGTSLILPAGWLNTLSGESALCGEYNTHELTAGVDNSENRAAWSGKFSDGKLADGTVIDYKTWLGGWKPFEGKDMTILNPDTSRTVTFQTGAGASVTDLAVDSKAAALNAKNQLLALKEAVVTFKIGMDDGYTLTDVTGATWANDIYTVTADTVVISTRSNSSSGGSSSNVPSTGGSKTQTTTNSDGSKTTTKTDRKGNVTVTTKAPDGSQVVAYTSKDGDKSITVTDAKGTVQAKVELPATIPAPAEKFADVPAGHWAEESINRMAGLGTIQGIGGGNYDMDSPITRGSVATILYRLSNVEVDAAKGAFADVETGDWYAEAVAWASGTGVVTGYSESVFAPKDSIDRQQLAVMLYRFAKLLRVDTATEADLTQFQDSAAVADWATEAMSWCVGKGILKGNGYGSLIPGGTASRAECATMLDRFIGLL